MVKGLAPSRVNTGGVVSITLTLKLHDALLPAPSVAVQATGVVPAGNTVGEVTITPLVRHTTVGAPQLSLPVTTKLTEALHWPAPVVAVNGEAGHVMVGLSVSATVTLKEQLFVEQRLVAVQVTTVTPWLNVLPLAGEQPARVPPMIVGAP